MADETRVDLAEVEKAFRKMVRAGADVRPAWRKLRPAFRQDQRDHMNKQEGPSGGWPSLARSTVEKRMRVGGRAGKYTKRGKLRKSAQRKLNRILSARLLTKAKVDILPHNMIITAELPWSGVHQEGGIVGKGSLIPPRPFMWVSDRLGGLAAEVLSVHLRDAFEGKKL